jgi:hypothetical protein
MPSNYRPVSLISVCCKGGGIHLTQPPKELLCMSGSRGFYLGAHSEYWWSDTSHQPQGTILDPLLFLAYINDLPNKVKSTARLSSDDCRLYKWVKTLDDATRFLKVLNDLQQWESDWLMHFNPDKCEFIRIAMHHPVLHPRKGTGHNNQTKYMWVSISNNLSRTHYIDEVYKKTNNTTDILRRNQSLCCTYTKDKCYKTLVSKAPGRICINYLGPSH